MRRALLLELLAAANAGEEIGPERVAGVTIQAEHVRGTVWALRGGGANVAVSVGPDGALLVDDAFAALVPALRAAIATLGPFPIRLVVNTHWHADHAGGNSVLAREVTVVAHRAARDRLGASRRDGVAGPVAPLPFVSFERELTVHANGEDVRVVHVPRAHTDGDCAVVFPRSNVVHLGDLFVTYGFPFVDVASGGSLRGLLAGLTELVGALPDDVKVIPGHGPVSSRAEVLRYVATLEECVARVAEARRVGWSLERTLAAGVLADHAHLGGALLDANDFTTLIHRELAAS
jgi:cyclase